MIENLAYAALGWVSGVLTMLVVRVTCGGVRPLWQRRTESSVSEQNPGPRVKHRRRLPATAVAILIAAAVVLALGVQQILYQQARDDRDDCVSDYNRRVESIRDTRIDAQDALSQAQQAKDDAGDNVLTVALTLITNPGTDAENRDALLKALTAFADARKHRDEVKASTTTTLAENSYPTLDCP